MIEMYDWTYERPHGSRYRQQGVRPLARGGAPIFPLELRWAKQRRRDAELKAAARRRVVGVVMSAVVQMRWVLGVGVGVLVGALMLLVLG